MVITGIDLETTGLDPTKGHRIIEVGALMYDFNPDTFAIKGVGKYVQKIFPDRSIDAAAQNVHGISIDDLYGQPQFEDVVARIFGILSQTDLLVAHNAEFDVSFLAAEFARLGKELPDIPVLCTMQEGRFATFDGTVPSLRKLCECFDLEYDLKKAHGAEYDIAQTLKCFFMGLRKGYYQLPELARID